MFAWLASLFRPRYSGVVVAGGLRWLLTLPRGYSGKDARRKLHEVQETLSGREAWAMLPPGAKLERLDELPALWRYETKTETKP